METQVPVQKETRGERSGRRRVRKCFNNQRAKVARANVIMSDE
jgi:hypothetical protein